MTADHGAIEDYAAIGDRRTCALVHRSGTIDWWCWPRFDGRPVLWRLLDPRGASWRVAPVAPAHTSRRYLEGANVLETTHRTATGVLRVIDLAPLGAGAGERSRLLRAATCLAGSVEVLCELDGSLGFGGDPPAAERARECVALRAGETRTWQLAAGAGELLRVEQPGAALDEIATTAAAWRRWADAIEYDGPHRDRVMRSALALAMLIDEATGAVVAAPTTSLPEVPGGVRNWDYRYCWLRDAAMTLEVLMELGRHDEAMAYWGWLGEVAARDQRLCAVYDVQGRHAPAEVEVDGVVGHAGSRPVRIGNAAREQLQLDVLGYVVASAYRCQTAMGQRHRGLDRVVARVADRAAAAFHEPDSGLWERRGPARHHLHGKLMCWVALDRALRLARRGWLAGDTDRWQEARGEIEKLIAGGADPAHGAYGSVIGGGSADAAALRVSAYGLLPPDDPRTAATLARVNRELACGPFVYRYREPDGLPGQEGAFFLCSFWRVEALAAAGRRREAEEAMAALCASGNDLGLLSEEIDPDSGRLLGNFPQAFSHLGLIRAALALAGRPVNGVDHGEERA